MKLDGLKDSVGQMLSRLPKGTSVQLAGIKRPRPTAEEDSQSPPTKQVHHDHSLSVVQISGSMSQAPSTSQPPCSSPSERTV